MFDTVRMIMRLFILLAKRTNMLTCNIYFNSITKSPKAMFFDRIEPGIELSVTNLHYMGLFYPEYSI